MDANIGIIDTVLANESVAVEDAAAERSPAKGKTTGKGITYGELALPQATVVKIVKDFLPSQAVLSKEAKDIFRKISAYFILYVTDCASDIALRKKRRTILPENILAALQELGFEDMTVRLNQILSARKRQQTKEKSSPILKAPAPQNDTEDAALAAVTDDFDDLDIHSEEEAADDIDQAFPAIEDSVEVGQDEFVDQDNTESFEEMHDEQRREVDITAFTASDDEE
ncbi:hypothetical protein RvY_11381 [Ramazzottius varieornatus]|uniref:DNA polymerase epsilon subunit 3 n=1 Tax=Ramazzottius varieornatus TaxID=947166 RepID=A0A1D1VG00_RAMVA|nr:hypothetical protein RvY_11381 [Ramazzottius varieornatus]